MNSRSIAIVDWAARVENFEKYPSLGFAGESLEKKLANQRPIRRATRRYRKRLYGWRRVGRSLLFLALTGILAIFPDFQLSPKIERVDRVGPPNDARQLEPNDAIVTVEEGDTLSSIAQRAYGRSARYHFLYWVNRETLKNSHWLSAGQKIKIP